MSITQRPRKTIDQFIESAPDGGSAAVSFKARKGKKIQISLTISEDLLKEVDAKAQKLGVSRAAWINLAIQGTRID
jgi:hypothetical protein